MAYSTTPKHTQEQLAKVRNCTEQTLADYYRKKSDIFYIVKNNSK
jgi:hypothetical protein